MILRFQKLRSTSKIPERANPSDAGLDCFADLDSHVMIEPHHNALIPTGIKLEVPHGYMAMICPRSGMAAKRSLVPGARVVDAGYAGEIFVDLHNYGHATQTIQPNDKIAQIVIIPVVHVRLEETEQVYRDPVCISNRGEGALGSTGN